MWWMVLKASTDEAMQRHNPDQRLAIYHRQKGHLPGSMLHFLQKILSLSAIMCVEFGVGWKLHPAYATQQLFQLSVTTSQIW